MLRIIQSKSVEQAKSYYTLGLKQERLGQGEYYVPEQELQGQWKGLGAERLGLHGAIDPKAFDALCENRHPLTGQPLTARTRKERRVGYDFNFHCPKSVSVVHGLTGDERILVAFQEAVSTTMREIEADARTRVRVKGADLDRTTGNLVWGEFTHFTARPVDGKPDPHLHAHCFTFNATWDQVEQRWKAAQLGGIKRDARYYEAVFHARLSRKMADLGYSIRREKAFWEIDGIPESVLKKFSKRTELIEKAAKEQGITDPGAKAALGAKTRKGKVSLTGKQLQAEWISRLSPTEQKALNAVRANAHGGGISLQQITSQQALDFATEHCFEKLSVVPERQLLEEALRFGLGHVEIEFLQKEFSKRGWIRREIDGQWCCTTPEVLSEERVCIRFVRAGRGTCRQMVPGRYRFQNDRLSEEQQSAILHLIHSRDRVIALRGAAGTGKTTLMKEAVSAMEVGGRQVFPFAPSAEASRGVLRKEGFSQAQTVAHLLENKALHERVKGQVLWIDEAGLLSTRQMREVFDLAEKQQCRVVLAGDTAQHRAVERGDALRLLETHAGMQSAVLAVNRRQQQQRHREAVALLRQGRAEEGLRQLDQLKAIAVIPEEGKRYRQLAKDYVHALNQKKQVLAVSPTHGEGALVTSAIRQALRENQQLRAKERPFPMLQDLRWSAAQRREAHRYQPGMVVQFHRDTEEFKQGEQLRVIGQGDGQSVLVERNNGAKQPLPLRQSMPFQVFEENPIALAAGDRVRITRNGKTVEGLPLSNGEMVQVKGFTKQGDIRLTNNQVLGRGFGHLSYGYCVTSHASQGKTVDQVFIAQSCRSERAASQEQFYVSASRFRESIRIYTDDPDVLRYSILQSGKRLSAMDLAGGVRLKMETPRQRIWNSVFQASRRRMTELLQSRISQALAPLVQSVRPKLSQGLKI